MSERLIAHRIFKEQKTKETSNFLRKKLISNSDQASRLLADLRAAVTRKSHPGQFAEPAGGKEIFQQRLERYLLRMSDSDFVTMSQDLTTFLEGKMKEQVMATGGFIVFAEHEFGGETLLLVALLSTQAGTTFDETMNPIDAQPLDFDHLRHGVRVRYNQVGDNTPGVVQFVAQKAEGVSDYFREFLGCEKIPDTSEQGHLLHKVLNTVGGAMGLDLDEINQIAFSYWEKCMKEQRDMSIEALARLIQPDDPKPLTERLTDEKLGLPGQFAPPPRKVMKRFIKFSYSEKGLKLEFDKSRWEDKINFRGTTVQIKDAPPSLIEKIKTELQNG